MSINESATGRAYAPFMVLNPGETLPQAMERHRRDTGHRGAVVVVGWNRGERSGPTSCGRVAGCGAVA